MIKWHQRTVLREEEEHDLKSSLTAPVQYVKCRLKTMLCWDRKEKFLRFELDLAGSLTVGTTFEEMQKREELYN